MSDIIKALLVRGVPLGATIALLQSSASPIQPALNAFATAINALSGENVSDSGFRTDDIERQAGEIAKVSNGLGEPKGLLDALFGGSRGKKKESAQAQLDAIINRVKGSSGEGDISAEATAGNGTGAKPVSDAPVPNGPEESLSGKKKGKR